MRSACIAVVLLLALPTAAQVTRRIGPIDEFSVWGTGGFSVPGGTRNVTVGSAGVRVGWFLTEDHGPRPLRGNFEYAIDVVPVYLVHQNSTVYGGGFNPVVLKWNFAPTWKDRVTPYIELGGGTLFSTHEVPTGTSAVNFRTHIGVGAHVWPVMLEVRYEHISNAGLSSPNPGINTLQFLVGMEGLIVAKRRHSPPSSPSY